MTGRDGVTVGSDRAAIVAASAHQPAEEMFGMVLVDGSQLRFELEGETAVAMSLIDRSD